MSTEPVQTEISNEAELYRYCRRCHRKLKSPVAMKAGYGKVCFRKIQQEA